MLPSAPNDAQAGVALQQAANERFRLPPPMFDARCKACWFVFALVCLTVASFWTLELKWAQFFSLEALRKMGKG